MSTGRSLLSGLTLLVSFCFALGFTTITILGQMGDGTSGAQTAWARIFLILAWPVYGWFVGRSMGRRGLVTSSWWLPAVIGLGPVLVVALMVPGLGVLALYGSAFMLLGQWLAYRGGPATPEAPPPTAQARSRVDEIDFWDRG